MTLEEMGRDYIRQSEDIWVRIQATELRIKGSFNSGSIPLDDYEKAIKELKTLYEMFDEMRATGERLVHYYDK